MVSDPPPHVLPPSRLYLQQAPRHNRSRLGLIRTISHHVRRLRARDAGPHRHYQQLLQMLDWLSSSIQELDQAVKKEAESRSDAVCLMSQPGVGPITALAFVLTLGPSDRFPRSKQLVSYLGLNPTKYSSGGKQRLGSISKQGNTMLRYLLVEAAHVASRFDPQLRRNYQRLQFRRGSGVAKVAIARKLAVRLYWQLREAGPSRVVGSHAG